MTHPTKASLDVPWYRSEAWLAVELAAFVPLSLAFLLPSAFQMPLFGMGAVLAVVGLGMLALRKPAPRDSASAGELGSAHEIREMGD